MKLTIRDLLFVSIGAILVLVAQKVWLYVLVLAWVLGHATLGAR